MGNRAVITNDLNGVGIYLHWNGGRDSVEAFLTYCKLRGFRSDSYGIARLSQVIGNFFGGGLSLGVDLCSHLDTDNGDNGTYIIKDWEIVDRKFFNGAEQNEYELEEMLLAIDESQPAKEQIGAFIKGLKVLPEELKIGDRIVYLDPLEGRTAFGTIAGIGEDRLVNGTNVKGIPYIDRYGNPEPASNRNNYVDLFDFRLAPAEEKKDEQTSVEMFINDELNGIELKFTSRPSQEVREELKQKGFKWHHKKAVWYAKNTPERLELAQDLARQLTK